MKVGGNVPLKTHREAVLEEPPIKTQTLKVSNTGYLLISCHKQFSFKLHVEGGSNSFVGSTVL